MNFAGTKILASPDGSNTSDIISALAAAVPAAINNVKEWIESNPNITGDPITDGMYFARYIQNNVKYKADGFKEQIIQLPGRMIHDTRLADCKSFSLAWLAMMAAAGHKNSGFRFASYRPNKVFTHVYNWTLDKNGKKTTFDTTLKNLKESPRFTNLKDMKVTYLAGTPTMVNDSVEMAMAARDEGLFGKGKERRAKRRERRQERREEKGKSGKPGKKIFLSPVRGAFLSLVGLNVRGLATKLSQSAAKDQNKVKQFWEKLGGDFNKLMNTVNKGKSKKALFGKGKGLRGATSVEYLEPGIGAVDWAAVGTFLATATPALVAASKLFKSQGIPEGEGDVADENQKNTPPLDPTGEGFTAADPEGSAATESGFNFKPSPLLIGGAVAGIALIYFLTRKKR
jgi:hypothetical protein